MSDSEPFPEDGLPLDPSWSVQRLVEHLDLLVKEAKEKDERLRNSQFVIKKMNQQLSEALEECRTKDAVINRLREEVGRLEKASRRTVADRAELQRAQEKLGRLTRTAEKSMQKLTKEAEEKNEQISRLSDFNQTLTSERQRLLETTQGQTGSNAKVQQLEKDRNKLQGDLKKAQKEVGQLEKENEKLRTQNRTLTERYRELHQEFQARKIEELMAADRQYGILGDTDRKEPAIELVDGKNRRRITKNLLYVYHKLPVRFALTTKTLFVRERVRRKFPIFSAFHVLKDSQTQRERSRQQLLGGYVIGKLRNIETELLLKLENFERRLRERLTDRLRSVHWLVLQEAKQKVGLHSELLTRSLDRTLWELESLSTSQ